MDAAAAVPIEKRDLYLQRLAAMLTMRGRGHVSDADVADVAQLALTGLAHQPAA
ncbi:MAG: hypothetical protein WCF50_13095 [Pseudolabrys sp.]